MDNKKVEQMLQDAYTELPITNLEWRVSDMTKKKEWNWNKKLVASVAVVVLLLTGSVTVLGNMEIQMDAKDYSMWVENYYRNFEVDAVHEMEKREFKLPDKIDEYVFEHYQSLLVVEKGTTYLEAFTGNVYNPLSFSYRKDDINDISVSIGTTEDAYWSEYFGYDQVDGDWIKTINHDKLTLEESIEYNGIILYKTCLRIEEDRYSEGWYWIDEEKELAWVVHVPAGADQDDKVDGLEIVKYIINMNK